MLKLNFLLFFLVLIFFFILSDSAYINITLLIIFLYLNIPMILMIKEWLWLVFVYVYRDSFLYKTFLINFVFFQIFFSWNFNKFATVIHKSLPTVWYCVSPHVINVSFRLLHFLRAIFLYYYLSIDFN